MSKNTRIIDACQICKSEKIEPVLFLGYLPPVNEMLKIGKIPDEQPSYPAQVFYCEDCHLVQLSAVVDPRILFPSEYPYTSSTTKILRENFADLYQKTLKYVGLDKDDLIIDIGSNDGNLLSNFKDGHKVLGVTPEDIGKIAIERGIPTEISYFDKDVAAKILERDGKAKVVTATNVFAHIDNINDILDLIISLLTEDGVFISESHYLLSLLETLQYDTIYHEHLRYYSLHSLKNLLESRGLEVFHVEQIPTHGGSIRVFASMKGNYDADETVEEILSEERSKKIDSIESMKDFREKVVLSKLQLHALLKDIKDRGERIFGIGAPSRASTLINYVGIDDGIVDYVLEIKGSYKIGNYMPGTLIRIEEESVLYDQQPEYAMLLSWHIAEELMPKIKEKGFKGDFIIPLPEPRIVRSEEV
jgi:hypothetical protein